MADLDFIQGNEQAMVEIWSDWLPPIHHLAYIQDNSMCTFKPWEGTITAAEDNIWRTILTDFMNFGRIPTKEEISIPTKLTALDMAKLQAYQLSPIAEPSKDQEKDTEDSVQHNKNLRPSIEEAPNLELKELPEHLEYSFLREGTLLPVIIASNLTVDQKSDLMEDDHKPSPLPQRRLNPNMKEVLRAEVIKLLNAGIIYPISDSEWVSSVQFGLCNAHATFQRRMLPIFEDMVEDFMEVFMDDFSIFGDSFDLCLRNLEHVLTQCEETNLVLSSEKCHFMVHERIVLDHKISKEGIEVFIEDSLGTLPKLPDL
ncbi:uncharacterized protein LOC120249962 [Dioscorea cayenensis subsp. rotundata]|uniref:Uncharacterized protein LOC120249962 n=1 Tax=Dioscorea cayennensis subsp. rotundata TaxID=55577 RepID=A0AB40AI42_DIOCR|nr:uncharacterized protein LOC120249962 [Dioscorea cayenensis subsp. rotundata]